MVITGVVKTGVIVKGCRILACVSLPWSSCMNPNFSGHESADTTSDQADPDELFEVWYRVLTCARMRAKRNWPSVSESVLIKAANVAEV